jgi:hypothetical protein
MSDQTALPPDRIAAMLETNGLDGAQPTKLFIEDSGCWAFQEEDVIKVYGRDGSQLFGVSPKVVSFESKPLFLLLQLYVTGFNNGRATGQQEIKTKVTELIKLAL